MIDWNASLEELMQKRLARLGLHVVFLKPTGRDPSPGDAGFSELVRDHLRYWWELEQRRQLVAAGPLDVETENPQGMAILATSSRQEAEALANDEPFHRAGVRRNEVHAWQLNEGLAVPLAKELTRRRSAP